FSHASRRYSGRRRSISFQCHCSRPAPPALNDLSALLPTRWCSYKRSTRPFEGSSTRSESKVCLLQRALGARTLFVVAAALSPSRWRHWLDHSSAHDAACRHGKGDGSHRLVCGQSSCHLVLTLPHIFGRLAWPPSYPPKASPLCLRYLTLGCRLPQDSSSTATREHPRHDARRPFREA